MRSLRLLAAILFLAVGFVIGGLNAQIVSLDLGFTEVDVPLGVALLAALLLGMIIGGLALTTSVILPLRRRLQQERKRATLASSAMREE